MDDNKDFFVYLWRKIILINFIPIDEDLDDDIT
jgi:hypothetical protein